ncbi:MAG TPA: hypothetical protein VK741_23430 [Acetobacteraceae bacterium]|jgi:hypothetical protein|nr:hypothetical protein [Acetobacteraceae bacterium]
MSVALASWLPARVIPIVMPPTDVLPGFVAFTLRGKVPPCLALPRRIPVRRAHRPVGLLAGTRRAARVRIRRNAKLPCAVSIAGGDLPELLGR